MTSSTRMNNRTFTHTTTAVCCMIHTLAACKTVLHSGNVGPYGTHFFPGGGNYHETSPCKDTIQYKSMRKVNIRPSYIVTITKVLWCHVICPDEQFTLELSEETGSRQRRVAWQTVPVHWTRDGETARPITGQASQWNDEVTVNGRTQMSAAGCRRHWDAHVGQVRRRHTALALAD